ncbi:MAG TPA: hypothetical protein VKP00_13430, partial [Gemmatimonadaceae bacterium]|nr:hypothetical protein [Gemmatimonadaceae bacterium]
QRERGITNSAVHGSGQPDRTHVETPRDQQILITRRLASVVVVRLVLSLGVHAFVGLTRVALFRGAHGLLLRARGPYGRQRQQSLEILTPAFRTRGHGRSADERFERVAAGTA